MPLQTRRKSLILFAHPRYENSRVNKALLKGIVGQEGITVHDLYEEYPDFHVDVARERKLLLEHQMVVLHYPYYFYGPPALLKQWMDVVLEHGWAHGAGGNKLENKMVFHTITTGGTRGSYSREGFHRHTLSELLFPMEQVAHLCRMRWLPPFVVQGTYRLTDAMLAKYSGQYREVLRNVGGASSLEEVREYEFLNDWLAVMNGGKKP